MALFEFQTFYNMEPEAKINHLYEQISQQEVDIKELKIPFWRTTPFIVFAPIITLVLGGLIDHVLTYDKKVDSTYYMVETHVKADTNIYITMNKQFEKLTNECYNREQADSKNTWMMAQMAQKLGIQLYPAEE